MTSIHEAISHAMHAGESDIGTSYIDGVIAPENEYRQVSPDIAHHVPFAALFYHGNPVLAKRIIEVWQMAAYRHWGFWFKHDKEARTLKIYTFKDEGANIGHVENALWYVQEDYEPTSDGAHKFWKALTANNHFLLLLRDKNNPIPTMVAITLKRVCNDEFVATDVSDLPHDLAVSMDTTEEAHGRTN